MARGNPRPDTRNLKTFPRIDENEAESRAVCVRIPLKQFEEWRLLPVEERNQTLRDAIAEKIESKKVDIA